MPNTVHTASLRVHARHSSLEHDGDGNVAGPSRPTTRSPSRPLSNTTTTTNTTVKPRSRKAPEHIAVPAPPPVSSATAEIVAQVVPMESGKSNPSRKGKRMNLFGILLPSPRKGSFGESFRGRSRPTTPSQSIPSTPAAAPEPMWPGRDDRPWTDKSGSQRSQKSIRKGLPVHVEEPPLPYLTSSTSREAERGGAFSGLVSSQVRDTPVHILNSPPRHRDPYGTSEDDPDVEVRTLEGRCSPFCGFGTSSKGSHTSQEKGKEKERARGSRDRSGERERERREREREREREKERITHPRRVGSPLQRMRESTSAVAVSAVPMEKTSSGRSANSKRSASRDHHGPPRAGVDNLATRTNRTKHGSFDFERPVSAGTGAGGGMSIRTALRSMGIGEPERQPLQRSSSARAVPMRKLPNDSGVGFEPSSLPSSRPLAEKGKKPARDVQFASRAARRPTFDGSVSTPAHHGHSSSHYPSRPNGTSHHHTQSHHGHHSTPPQHAHHSTQSQSHNTQHRRDAVPASPLSSASGDSSGHTRDGSWGRSAAKRTPSARTSHAHGLFKFEPAVPPIPGSPADDRRGAPRAVSRPTSPSPLPAPEAGMSKSSQARLAGRGRSLDLGLGLTWAPSKVREDALLRVGPRSGTSMSTSGATRARSRWRGADEDGRLTVGVASDVAEAFKEALGDSAYAIFKNCQCAICLRSRPIFRRCSCPPILQMYTDLTPTQSRWTDRMVCSCMSSGCSTTRPASIIGGSAYSWRGSRVSCGTPMRPDEGLESGHCHDSVMPPYATSLALHLPVCWSLHPPTIPISVH